MYSIRNYGEMILDATRMDAYVRALRQTVKAGSVVADIGTGTGVFAMLACRLGARRVFALEPSDAILLAREIASDNGCADKIEFIQAMSTETTLPERADVIISDLRGILPFFEGHLVAIADARQRLLAPGGVMIPRSDTLWVTAVEAADQHRRITAPWTDNGYGLDMTAARKVLANSYFRATIEPEQMIAAPQCCGTLDYRSIENTDFSAEVRLPVVRAGTAHGICVWFDATLAEGIHFSNAPGKSALIYGSAFFPWPEPLGLDVGDVIALKLRADLVGDDYVWSWDTRVSNERDPDRKTAHFKQSGFYGALLSPGSLRKRAASHVARLSEHGEIDRIVLSRMGEEMPLADIARELASRFPGRFARWQEALAHVGELSMRYSR